MFYSRNTICIMKKIRTYSIKSKLGIYALAVDLLEAISCVN